MITIRRARSTDAASIGAVHVAAWRSAYPGILPDGFLAKLSPARQAAYYDDAIRSGTSVHVATASGLDIGPSGGPPRIVGFVSAGRSRVEPDGTRLADGEIETLYVLDDWRERGVGRRLMKVAAAQLASTGCCSVFLWVLRDNPSRWFYERLGGRAAAQASIKVGGAPLVQTAYVWSPIEKLAQATSQAS